MGRSHKNRPGLHVVADNGRPACRFLEQDFVQPKRRKASDWSSSLKRKRPSSLAGSADQLAYLPP